MGATVWDPNTTETPGSVRSLVTGKPLSRELLLASLSSEKRLMSQRLGGGCVAGYNVNIHSALTGRCAHCEDRCSTARLLSPALSPPQWPGRPGAGELSLAQLQLSERPDTEHHTADTGDWTGEHVIF